MLAISRRERGDYAEAVVADYLRAASFQILARNYKILRGEIDLIAQKGDLIVFVEVKFRQRVTHDYGELVPRTKQQRIIAAARCWVQEQPINVFTSYRFDVAYVLRDYNLREVSYLPDAFSAEQELW